MNIKNCLQARTYSNPASMALLLVRLCMGAAFVLHGWGKMQSPMGWMGPDAPVPGFLQLLATIAEFGGGISLILGFLVPLSSFGLICTMLVATSLHAFMLKDPFVGSPDHPSSFELPLLYLALSVFFFIVGPGKFSADSKIFGAK